MAHRTALDELRGRAAAEQRWHPGTRRAAEAAEAYQRARVEQRIRDLVEAAPQLTPEQIDRLAILFRPSVSASDSAA